MAEIDRFCNMELEGPKESDSFNEEEVKVTNIALVGDSGSGKSSFINAIMKSNNQEAVAEAGITRPTSKPECYPHPRCSSIILWDLPGVGTAAYPDSKTYYNELLLAPETEYDAFLLFTRDRFTFNSQDLAIRLECSNKPLFFIRTCIDVDVDNEGAGKENFNEKKLEQKIRKNILDGLQDLDTVSSEQIFLISNVEPKKWDFSRLSEREVLYELPSSRTASCFTRFHLQSKLALLHSRKKRSNQKSDKEILLQFVCTYMPELKRDIQDKGIMAAQKKMQQEIEGWKEVKISLAIIGSSGCGKSSFINAIRGIKNGQEGAARTGATETTKILKEYFYPHNENITLWDCPGIGSPALPDLETYSKNVDIGEFDAFIIMTAARFNAHAGDLARKLKSVNKPFFFARTKIDVDYSNEKQDKGSAFNEVMMLNEIKADCSKNLEEKDAALDENDIFLISNRHPYKWDFARLYDAVNNRLPPQKRDCFLFSMLTLSENILGKKVKILKGRVKYVAFFQSILLKPFTKKSYSEKKDLKLIVEKVKFYWYQLGFPEKDSEEFQSMNEELQRKIDEFQSISEMNVESWLIQFHTESNGKDTERADEFSSDTWKEENFLKAIESPYTFVYHSLRNVLDKMKDIGMEILKVAAARSEPVFDSE